jgi:telomerase reverse transcriptase
MTLEEVLQGLKVSELKWLAPPGDHKKMARSDFEKRKQLLAEFIYYLIDSFVIPLIRSNFHVTESNGNKNRLFYFRHDVWRQLTEPSISELKRSMFQDIGSKPAKTLLSGRSLGYSQIRMLPKKTDFRPIANLRKRPEYLHYGKRMLGKSVNSTLTPAFKVLNYEKVCLYQISLSQLSLTCILGPSSFSTWEFVVLCQRHSHGIKRISRPT